MQEIAFEDLIGSTSKMARKTWAGQSCSREPKTHYSQDEEKTIDPSIHNLQNPLLEVKIAR